MDRPGAAACPPDDPDDVHRRRMVGLVPTAIILTLELLTYGLRIYCRKKTRQGIRWDDILMGIGILISLEPAICEFLLLANGLGHHICHLPIEERNRFAIITFALQRANQPALACIKISILLMYLRLFSSERWLRWAAYVNMAYTIAWAVSTWIVNLTVCTPIAFYYDRTIPGGRCINQAVSGSVNAGLSLLGDVCILALPLPMVWRLNINTRRKVAICGIFMLGCLTCVASAIRIAELIKFVPTDATYTQVYASTWTTLELGVAAISGNLPLLAPLFERFFRRHTTSSYYRYRYDGPRSGRSGPPRCGGGTSALSIKNDTIVNISRSSGLHAGLATTGTTVSVKSGCPREFDHHHHHHHRRHRHHHRHHRGDHPSHGRLSSDDDDDDDDDGGKLVRDLDAADVESQTTRFGDGGSGGGSGAGSEHNIELDDRAILVRTHVDITTEPAPECVQVGAAGGGDCRAKEEHARVVESWARAAAR